MLPDPFSKVSKKNWDSGIRRRLGKVGIVGAGNSWAVPSCPYIAMFLHTRRFVLWCYGRTNFIFCQFPTEKQLFVFCVWTSHTDRYTLLFWLQKCSYHLILPSLERHSGPKSWNSLNLYAGEINANRSDISPHLSTDWSAKALISAS